MQQHEPRNIFASAFEARGQINANHTNMNSDHSVKGSFGYYAASQLIMKSIAKIMRLNWCM